MVKIKLKCGCIVSDSLFILGKRCKMNNCIECSTLVFLHPFGNKRLSEVLK